MLPLQVSLERKIVILDISLSLPMMLLDRVLGLIFISLLVLIFLLDARFKRGVEPEKDGLLFTLIKLFGFLKVW